VGIHLPFTTAAVVVAQIVVSAPFYLQAAVNAFRKVDLDLLVVARTLGASPVGAILRVAVPVALPGLMGGAALSWARAIGEFGATLLFAGNLEGTTRTMPLAIFSALESDVRAAQALSVALAICAVAVLLGLRALPSLWRQRVNPAAAGPVPEAASP
jgi:molybdate transport system permease protein